MTSPSKNCELAHAHMLMGCCFINGSCSDRKSLWTWSRSTGLETNWIEIRIVFSYSFCFFWCPLFFSISHSVLFFLHCWHIRALQQHGVRLSHIFIMYRFWGDLFFGLIVFAYVLQAISSYANRLLCVCVFFFCSSARSNLKLTDLNLKAMSDHSKWLNSR